MLLMVEGLSVGSVSALSASNGIAPCLMKSTFSKILDYFLWHSNMDVAGGVGE